MPTQVFTSTTKFQRIICLNHHTQFLIWRREKVQALRGFLRNFIRWAAWNPMRMKVLHQDCRRMLRTRFVLLVESSMIRRYSITRHSWMTSTVFPAALSGSLCELTDFTIRMFGRMCKNIVAANWPACAWSRGPCCENREIG